MQNKGPVIANFFHADTTRPDQFLEDLLGQYPQYFDSILKNRTAWNVQVIYTAINRDSTGRPSLQNHSFNLNSGHYFYPASTVKLPVVMLALQKLNELKAKGIDMNSTIITEANFSGQTAVYNDPTTAAGKPSIAQYIKKILMVSDNDAYNRLFEFLGQQYINEELYKKGYREAQVLHRLDIFLTEEENRRSNPIKFLDSNNRLQFVQSAQYSRLRYLPRKDSIGRGYFKEGQLINEPMNFSRKNRISLQNLHDILISLLFPELFPLNQRFNLDDTDKAFIMKYMSQLPTESFYPAYGDDTANYWPAYGKFLLYGKRKGKLPKNIRIFNKEGEAYGHLLDVAYVCDFANNIEFFLSALIYCNNDGILNDDKYDYQETGLPFLKHLGEVIYMHELKREKKFSADLSPFMFKYDK